MGQQGCQQQQRHPEQQGRQVQEANHLLVQGHQYPPHLKRNVQRTDSEGDLSCSAVALFDRKVRSSWNALSHGRPLVVVEFDEGIPHNLHELEVRQLPSGLPIRTVATGCKRFGWPAGGDI